MKEGFGLKAGDSVMMKRDKAYVKKQMSNHGLKLDWNLGVALGKKVKVVRVFLGSETVVIECDHDEENGLMDVPVPRNCVGTPVGQAKAKKPAVKPAARGAAKLKSPIAKVKGKPADAFKTKIVDRMKKGSSMTPAQYRNERIKLGCPVYADQHVLHIIAKANGGADHPDNYFVGNGKMNLALGHRNDHVMAWMVGKLQTIEAVKISKKLRNYRGPSALQLYQQGAAEHRDQRGAEGEAALGLDSPDAESDSPCSV
mgnify:CR=1 FL=1